MYAYRKANGKMIGSDDWSIDHENHNNTAWTGIWKDGNMVAIVFVKMEDQDDDFSDMINRLHDQADDMIAKLNREPV